MGKTGTSIVGVDRNELVEKLNQALCEEWLAYYQYWIGAKVMSGPMRSDIEKELELHATEELNHGLLVVTRLIQLGGTPVLSPEKWMKLSHCRYEAPQDPYIEKVLNQNLNGERCAIETYEGLASFTQGKDHTTYNMAVAILGEEIEHEQDIEDWLEDIERLKKNMAMIQA